MKNFVLTFNTQLDAVIAKKVCEKENIICKLAPVPRSLSSSCGTCAFITTDNTKKISNISYEEIFIIKKGEYVEYERS